MRRGGNQGDTFDTRELPDNQVPGQITRAICPSAKYRACVRLSPKVSLAVSVSLVVSAFLLRLSSISLSFSPLCVFVYLRVLILCIYRLSKKYKSICVCPSSILRECCVHLPYPISGPKAILRVARKIGKSLEMSPHGSFLPLPLRPSPSRPLPSPPARPPASPWARAVTASLPAARRPPMQRPGKGISTTLQLPPINSIYR